MPNKTEHVHYKNLLYGIFKKFLAVSAIASEQATLPVNLLSIYKFVYRNF